MLEVGIYSLLVIIIIAGGLQLTMKRKLKNEENHFNAAI